MTACCFCRDDLENHTGNLQHPGGVDRWLCGTCVQYAITLRHLEDMADCELEAADVEAKATELATGIERTRK